MPCRVTTLGVFLLLAGRLVIAVCFPRPSLPISTVLTSGLSSGYGNELCQASQETTILTISFARVNDLNSLYLYGMGRNQTLFAVKREVESLRSEVGTVAVAEPSNLYVQPLDDSFDSRLQFRWRVYVPPERKAKVVVEIQQPRNNWLGHLSMALESGETGFELVAMPPLISDVTTAWQYKLRQPMSGRSNGVSGPRPPWVNDELASGGMAFEDFDPSQGAAEGNTLTLMDLSSVVPRNAYSHCGAGKALSTGAVTCE